MTFNFRIVEDDSKPEPQRSIREVYYKDGEITLWSEQPIKLEWGAGEDMRDMVNMLLTAFRSPVLKESELRKKEVF